jgi:transcriptional regulator with XRE-family HTH domain
MNLKELRESRGLTRRDVAIAIGATEQTVFNIESQKPVSHGNLIKMAEFFDCSTDFILGRESTSTKGGTDL